MPFGLEKLGLPQAMKEKSIDIALDVMAPTVFFQRARGADLYIIAGWRNQRANVVVGSPDLKSMRDLKGKRIGVLEIGGAGHLAIKACLRRVSLDPERDVEYVGRVYFPLNIDSLKNGKVDCIILGSWQAEKLEKEGFKIIAKPRKLYPDGFPTRIIAATGNILESNPGFVKAFLKGMIRVYWFFRDQPKNFSYIYNLEKRLRFQSPEPGECETRFANASPEICERWPFPIDGLPSGFEALLEEEREAGQLNYEVPPIREVCALDLVREAFRELTAREELKPEFERAQAVMQRFGY